MKIKHSLFFIAILALSLPVTAQDAHGPSTNKIEYSPYPGNDYPNQIFFGETHLHTSYSADAGLVGATLPPDDAYRFAKGQTVTSSSGVEARLNRPLDFMVITDHAENLGLPAAINESNPDLLKSKWGKMIHDLAKKGTLEAQIEAYDEWQKVLNALNDPLKNEKSLTKTMWQRVTAAAENHNIPGHFTALIGFEWTLQANGNNLHRNVIFRDGKDEANQIVPISQYDAQDPEKLWDWMEGYEKKTGGGTVGYPTWRQSLQRPDV